MMPKAGDWVLYDRPNWSPIVGRVETVDRDGARLRDPEGDAFYLTAYQYMIALPFGVGDHVIYTTSIGDEYEGVIEAMNGHYYRIALQGYNDKTVYMRVHRENVGKLRKKS